MVEVVASVYGCVLNIEMDQDDTTLDTAAAASVPSNGRTARAFLGFASGGQFGF